MWTNFSLIHMFHVQNFEISPHDRFFLHGPGPWARDKYEVWSQVLGQSLSLSLLLLLSKIVIIVINRSLIELKIWANQGLLPNPLPLSQTLSDIRKLAQNIFGKLPVLNGNIRKKIQVNTEIKCNARCVKISGLVGSLSDNDTG